MNATTGHRPCYAHGEPYRPPRGRRLGRRDVPPSVQIDPSGMDWPTWWDALQHEMKARGYRKITRRFYRFVLRRLAAFCQCPPDQVTRKTLDRFLGSVAGRNTSWHWTGMIISVLRTSFDKLGGRSLTTGLRTPKRSHRLPDIPTPEDLRALLNTTETLRDRILLGLMAGCGLKPGEACRIRWRDLDTDRRLLRIQNQPVAADREVPLPEELLPVLAEGKRIISREETGAEAWLFAGRCEGSHLGTRMVDKLVQAHVRKAGLEQRITPMTLRHAFSVHNLEAGMHICVLQQLLGHQNLETTLRYTECSLPDEVTTPGCDSRDIAIPVLPIDVEPPPVAEPLPAAKDLFDHPLTELPLEAFLQTPDHPLRTFYNLLKTRLASAFGSTRSARPPP